MVGEIWVQESRIGLVIKFMGNIPFRGSDVVGNDKLIQAHFLTSDEHYYPVMNEKYKKLQKYNMDDL